MSQENTIKELLQKFIKNECDDSEIDILIAYLKEVKGIGNFPSLEEVKLLVQQLPQKQEKYTRTTSEEILEAARKREKTILSRKRWRYASVAAVFIGAIALAYFYLQGAFESAADGVLIPPNEVITLKLQDGSVQIIDPEENKDVIDPQGNVVGNQQKSQLTYQRQSSANALAYNTLTVPYGKRFELVLSDGTKVFMNSGTQLKYPVSFVNGRERNVFISGEAYFDVAHDSAHPFIVNAEELDVTVLGTEFNVLAYPEDGLTDVVLVEGSVGLTLHDAKEDVLLLPGEKGIVDRVASIITTQEVNTNIYTAWRDGVLVFRNMPFKNLIKKLERHYNIQFINENVALGEEIFNASFNAGPIEQVLGYLNTSYSIDYTIKNNTVYIK